MFDIQKIRADFPILSIKVKSKPLVYFDNGATTLKPKCVIDKLVDYYTSYTSNIHRGDYDNAMKTICIIISFIKQI